MIDEFIEIVVLRQHLERWDQVLRWAHGHFAALDLSDNYRAGRPNLEASKITKALSRITEQLEGYLDDEKSDEDE